jgi:ankyrin repeat protein
MEEPLIIRFSKKSLTIGVLNLLKDNASVVNNTGYNKQTSLMIAAQLGNNELISILLRFGANPNLIDSIGKRALDHTKDRNCQEILQRCTSLVSPLYE